MHLEAVLIGNAAAALQGAPVTTIDFDFMFRKTPRNLSDLIERWQKRPPERRTNFLRKRLGPGRSAL